MYGESIGGWQPQPDMEQLEELHNVISTMVWRNLECPVLMWLWDRQQPVRFDKSQPERLSANYRVEWDRLGR